MNRERPCSLVLERFEVLRYRILGAQLSLILENEDRRGGDGLCGGRHLEDSVLFHGKLVSVVLPADRFMDEDLAVPGNEQDGAANVTLVERVAVQFDSLLHLRFVHAYGCRRTGFQRARLLRDTLRYRPEHRNQGHKQSSSD